MGKIASILTIICLSGCTKGASPTEPCLVVDTIAYGEPIEPLRAAETRCVYVRYGAE